MPGEVVSREEWLAQRKALLLEEKDTLHASDALNAKMRDFPMVRLDKDYAFEGPSGKVSLRELFDGQKQLIVYHFMLDPDWDEGCSSCAFTADHFPHLSHLRSRNTAFAAVSRAPMAKIAAFKARMAWAFPWVSSFASPFNYDFRVTLDPAIAPVEYNYEDEATLLKKGLARSTRGELSGLSFFYREGEDIFHSYSTYGRGIEGLLGTYALLDKSPLGRQEEGMSVKMAGWRLHDMYDEE